MASRQRKRERFEGPPKKSRLVMVVAVLVVLGVVAFALLNQEEPFEDLTLHNVGPVSYQGMSIQMTEVESNVADGKVRIALAEVTEHSIIYTEYSNGSVRIPLTAYVSPTGGVVAAVSVCEPCSGYTFHIEGSHLVCNACGTRWTLDGLKGVSGGCQSYPPDALEYVIDDTGQYILLDEETVANWEPREL